MFAFLVFLVLTKIAYRAGAYEWSEEWFPSMPLDHFSYGDNRTFSLRYLINIDHWTPGAGPLFFYCGNEGNIEMFAKNTGFMWDIADEFGAMLVFAEHRYYGKTLPFGNHSFASLANLGYLSSEQALADYATLVPFLRSKIQGAANMPVIAFGGSYGGMLAAWFRMKYPHIITGSLAASAPILQFQGVTPCWTFASIATETFHKSGKNCDLVIKRSWPVIRNLSQSDSGRDSLNNIFHLCESSKLNKSEDAQLLVNWLTDTYGNMAMVDYPYPANFLNPTPAWPVKAACSYMANYNGSDTDILLSVYNGVSIFQNYTGSTKCYNLGQSAAPSLGESGWEFQACTEMVMPMCQNSSDMFENGNWNLTAFADFCNKKFWGVATRPFWALTNYGGLDLSSASNIIFSNGMLDPWHGGGVLNPEPYFISNSLYVIKIKEAAHHYDLRGTHQNDTQAVKDVRKFERRVIWQWIYTDYFKKKQQILSKKLGFYREEHV